MNNFMKKTTFLQIQKKKFLKKKKKKRIFTKGEQITQYKEILDFKNCYYRKFNRLNSRRDSC